MQLYLGLEYVCAKFGGLKIRGIIIQIWSKLIIYFFKNVMSPVFYLCEFSHIKIFCEKRPYSARFQRSNFNPADFYKQVPAGSHNIKGF